MEFLRQAVRASDQRMGRVESSMARKEFWICLVTSMAVSELAQRKDCRACHVGTSGQESVDDGDREKLRGAYGLWLDIDDDERQVHCKMHVVSEYKCGQIG